MQIPEYGSQELWSLRYKMVPENFDWYVPYKQLKALFTDMDIIHAFSMSIIIPGVGASSLPKDMYDDGCKHITCIDSSPEVIKAMQALNVDRGEIKCK